jgi:hypothetical protein
MALFDNNGMVYFYLYKYKPMKQVRIYKNQPII